MNSRQVLELAAMLDVDLQATAVDYVEAVDALERLYNAIRVSINSAPQDPKVYYAANDLAAGLVLARRSLSKAGRRPPLMSPSQPSPDQPVAQPREPGQAGPGF